MHVVLDLLLSVCSPVYLTSTLPASYLTLAVADVSFIGKTDEYKGAEITTSAMGEGAIEGVADDYEVLGKFDTAFKFSRWGLSTAQPRDSSKLTGDKIKREEPVGAASAIF